MLQHEPLLGARSRSSAFWNEYTETMPRELLDELHLKRLQALLRYAYDRVPFYRNLYQEADMVPEDIKSLDDFNRYVPTIDKKDLLRAQAVNPPWGDSVALSPDYNLYQFQTSGSTGTPLRIPFSLHSQLQYGEQWVYLYWGVGIRPSDSFYFAFPWGMFAGFWSAYWGVRCLGATVISGGGLNSEQRLRQIQLLKPTVLVSTPTYAIYLIELAKELGIDTSATSIRYTIHAGEPGASIPTTRQVIESGWGAKAFELYGVAEAGAIAPGCPDQHGCHFAEDQGYATVVDASGNPVGDGEVGENVVTSYCQMAQPIIKYRTHDLVRAHYGVCSCGRTWLLYDGGVLGRTDDMITIKGTNVYPAAIEYLLADVPGVGSHYELHVARGSLNDEVMVKVEPQPGVSAETYPHIEKGLQQVFKTKIGVSISVNVVNPGELPRYELKAKRFFDHRPKNI
ncbi:MAG: phenylacetate--CoA ligase family protein [Actinomycetota bacterium]|nr:MAG: phenylacetate--CoA ligase family protein [Actinomycetota bacterium]